MNKMTYDEILEKVKQVHKSVGDFAYDDSDGSILGVGDYKCVDHYGGEDDGSSWHVVYYFPDHDVYMRIDGFYQSYSGVDFWDGWGCVLQVRPKSKTITVYE